MSFPFTAGSNSPIWRVYINPASHCLSDLPLLMSMYTFMKGLKHKGHVYIMDPHIHSLTRNRCGWPQLSEEGVMSSVLSCSKCKSPTDSIGLHCRSLSLERSNRTRAIRHDSLSFSAQYRTSATSADSHSLAHCEIEHCYSPVSHSKLKQHPKGLWNFFHLYIFHKASMAFSFQPVCLWRQPLWENKFVLDCCSIVLCL